MQPGDEQVSTHPPTLVVGVGASAGGLAAFEQLVSGVVAGSGLAFVLVQHQDPRRESLLPELLARWSRLPVVTAADGVPLAADTVCVARTGAGLEVEAGRLVERDPGDGPGVRLAVDQLFRSLARAYGTRAAGVVLSGGGSDGTAGLRELRAAGGLAVAQAPETAAQPSMPDSAIMAGAVDLVLPVEDIPGALVRYARYRGQEGELEAAGMVAVPQDALDRLAALLDKTADFDIRQYKPTTVRRRVTRRMGLSGFDAFAPYLEHLEADEGERTALVRDLFIGVTDFFRNPEAFESLRQVVIAQAVAAAPRGGAVRAWITGCATGEEAYTVAMLLVEAVQAREDRVEVQVFATDVDPDALATARAGVYPASIADHLSPERLTAFFSPVDGRGYQVRPALRDVISFAVHDLCRDPPFSRMDLVTCRNVMIYLTPAAQEQVLRILHFALKPDGHLMLGTSETVGPRRDLFTPVSKPWRIYRKVPVPPATALPRANAAYRRRPPTAGELPPPPRPVARGPLRAGMETVREALLDVCLGALAVVSASDALLYTHGDLSPWLRLPTGEPRLDLLSLLRDHLATRTRTAVYRCRRDGVPVTAWASQGPEAAAQTRISVWPAHAVAEGAVIVGFEDVELPAATPVPGHEASEKDGLIEQLERELMATREDLRNTVEELETSNEELRASSEESMSMNEELQSANEELEATTEELRSLNEELSTVNAQLKEKVELVELANADLQNLFASTRLATVFLDDSLRVRRFTPAAAELLRLSESDQGRYIGDLARDLLSAELLVEARSVLECFEPANRELRSAEGRWYVRRILPYRTERRRVDGVVVTFTDVTDLELATERIATRERQQAVVARLGLRALQEEALPPLMDQVVREVRQTLGVDFVKILELQPGGRKLLLKAGGGWRPGLVGRITLDAGTESQAGFTLSVGEPVIVDDLRVERRFSGLTLLREHGVISGLSCVIADGDGAYGVIGAHTATPRTFTPDDANFLQSVANVLANAIARHHARQRLAFERDLAHLITETRSLHQAGPRLLEACIAELGVLVAELWVPDAAGEALTCAWLRMADSLPPGSAARWPIRELSIHRGESFLGRIWAAGLPMWLASLGDPGTFLRASQAVELGLTCAIGFPVMAGQTLLGVVGLFSGERPVPDEALLRSLETAGRTLGEFLARVRAEEAIRTNEERLRLATEATDAGIFELSLAGGGVTYASERIASLLGYTTDELPSSDRLYAWVRDEVVHPDDQQAVARAVVEFLEGRRPSVSAELRVRHKHEQYVWIRGVGTATARDEDGKPVLVTGLLWDISERKRAEEALREADRQKDQFLAMLGHELRNPLAAIRGASDLLQSGYADDPKLRRAWQILDRQSTHMARLVDGLLDVSRIVLGKLEVEACDVDLTSLVEEVIQDRAVQLEARELTLIPDLQPGLWVRGDRIRLAQVFDNLLGNAIKFTQGPGRIEVTAARVDAEVVVRVRDSGIGIPGYLLPRIFEPFQQGPQDVARTTGGLGLGLALARRISELHGGSVVARSEGEGRGSELEVRLPATAAPRAARDPAAGEGQRSRRILVVEDNEDAATLLRDVLELTGHLVELAPDGASGLDAARARRPDVIFCDLGLPGMSGLELARAVRADEQLRDVYLVALTGYGQAEDRRRSRDAGFDQHLTKPVDLPTLERVLATIATG